MRSQISVNITARKKYYSRHNSLVMIDIFWWKWLPLSIDDIALIFIYTERIFTRSDPQPNRQRHSKSWSCRGIIWLFIMFTFIWVSLCMQGNTYHIFFINNNNNGLQINVKIKCMRGRRERELTLSLLVSRQFRVLPCSIVCVFSDNLHCPSHYSSQL